jgi:signal transduction histidine kinase/CheY-like chemotaxis protein
MSKGIKPNLPRSLSLFETLGFALAGPPGWTGLVPAMKAAIGIQSIFVWIPATIVGILINYQIKHLGIHQVSVAGGTPNYIARLLKRYPLIARYAAIGYLLNWVSTIPLNAIILADLVNTNLQPSGIQLPTLVMRILFMLLPFVVAMTGTRALSILVVCFIMPSIGLLLTFSLQGLGWLMLAPNSPGFFPQDWAWGSLSWVDWAKWFFFATFVTYSSETASSFVADSRRPANTLKLLDLAAWLGGIIFCAGSWVVLRLAPTDSTGDVFLYLNSAARPFWGESSSWIVTFLLASSCLLTMATAVSNCPRILYQLAQDGYLAPVSGVVSSRGVFGPALILVLGLSMCGLVWGNVAQIVVVGNVGWFVSFTLMQLALWWRRHEPGVLAPRLALGIFAVQAVILLVGGWAWGWQDFLIGLSAPIVIVLVDAGVAQIRFALFQPTWWQRLYGRNQRPYKFKDPLLFQVLTLIFLVCGSVFIGWEFQVIAAPIGGHQKDNLLLIALLIVAFVGVAIACWTTLPQVTALEEAHARAESLNEDLEIRVERRTEDLKKAMDLADTANHAKSEFLASMSHELRTPLNGILGYAQILQQSPTLSVHDRRGVDTIDRCGSHLLTLINDVLDLSKIEANKLELNPQMANLPNLIQGVVEICQIRAEQKGLHFLYEPDRGLPSRIEIDEKRLRQVLINLLGNAAKFTEQGHVRLRVWVNRSPNSNSIGQLCCQVEDTGVGMNPAQVAQIFIPFEQVGDAAKRSEGTGLGLSISQKIVAAMGGTIRVQSELGRGSTFEFAIDCPILQEVLQEVLQEPNPATTPTITGYKGNRKTVLIIDDNPDNRSMMVGLLTPLGFGILSASDGLEGLAKAIEHQPDLIITDLAMPGMDGWEFLHQLRQTRAVRHTVAIASSASVFDRDAHRSLVAGATDFLPKPVRLNDLYHLMTKHLAIDWIEVAAPTLEVTSVKSVTSTNMMNMVIPSASELAGLIACAERGQIKGIQAELEKLLPIDPQYQLFVDYLGKAAQEFNIARIRHFLQDVLNPSQLPRPSIAANR